MKKYQIKTGQLVKVSAPRTISLSSAPASNTRARNLGRLNRLTSHNIHTGKKWGTDPRGVGLRTASYTYYNDWKVGVVSSNDFYPRGYVKTRFRLK